MVANSLAEIAQQAVGQLHHLLGIDVEGGTMHRPQHLVGHGGGSGDRQKFPACANDHGCCSLLLWWAMLAMAGDEIKAHREIARRSAWGVYAAGKHWESGYRLVSRQPAASASSTEQNQRVPLLICILIWAYQRLLGV